MEILLDHRNLVLEPDEAVLVHQALRPEELVERGWIDPSIGRDEEPLRDLERELDGLDLALDVAHAPGRHERGHPEPLEPKPGVARRRIEEDRRRQEPLLLQPPRGGNARRIGVARLALAGPLMLDEDVGDPLAERRGGGRVALHRNRGGNGLRGEPRGGVAGRGGVQRLSEFDRRMAPVPDFDRKHRGRTGDGPCGMRLRELRGHLGAPFGRAPDEVIRHLRIGLRIRLGKAEEHELAFLGCDVRPLQAQHPMRPGGSRRRVDRGRELGLKGADPRIAQVVREAEELDRDQSPRRREPVPGLIKERPGRRRDLGHVVAPRDGEPSPLEDAVQFHSGLAEGLGTGELGRLEDNERLPAFGGHECPGQHDVRPQELADAGRGFRVGLAERRETELVHEFLRLLALDKRAPRRLAQSRLEERRNRGAGVRVVALKVDMRERAQGDRLRVHGSCRGEERRGQGNGPVKQAAQGWGRLLTFGPRPPRRSGRPVPPPPAGAPSWPRPIRPCRPRPRPGGRRGAPAPWPRRPA